MTQSVNKLDIASRRHKAPLVLASSSIHRRVLLERLRIPFVWEAPNVDETPRPGETPYTLVERLAVDKALAVADRYPGRLIIGSDQACVIEEQLLGKPGTVEAAIEQLTAASGRRVLFLTSICVLTSGSPVRYLEVVPCDVNFRTLTEQQIAAYVRAERPFDCAGSFRSEGLGIALFESMRCEDPTALTGLPLMALARLLAKNGYDIFEELLEDGDHTG